MLIAYLILSLLALLLFGPWGFFVAVIVGLFLLLANASGSSSDKSPDTRPGYKQVAEPRTKAGWKGMANKKLSAREIEMREMDMGIRHLGDKRSAQSAKSDDPWGNKAVQKE